MTVVYFQRNPSETNVVQWKMTSERGIPKVPKDLCKGAEVINCTRIEPTLGVDLSGEVERQWLSRIILLFKGFSLHFCVL